MLRCHMSVTLTALAIVGCAASPQRPLEARVTEYGLYARGTETIHNDPSVPSGQTRGSSGYQLRQATREVPLAVGTSFGFCYEVSGLEAGSTPRVSVEATHPSFARPGQPPVGQHSFPRKLVASDGVIRDCTGYGFDHPFELIPGTWHFSVIVNGAPVLTQEFTAR
jgi:hypothetical protein